MPVYSAVVLCCCNSGPALPHRTADTVVSAPVPTDSPAPADAVPSGMARYVPTFSFADLPAGPLYTGPVATPDFSTCPGARRFRTAIRHAAERGVNFAGRYIIAMWGCGTACQQSVVLDARTGRIASGLPSSGGLDYRIDSRLLVVNPPEADGWYRTDCASCAAPELYVWNGAEFHRLP